MNLAFGRGTGFARSAHRPNLGQPDRRAGTGRAAAKPAPGFHVSRKVVTFRELRGRDFEVQNHALIGRDLEARAEIVQPGVLVDLLSLSAGDVVEEVRRWLR